MTGIEHAIKQRGMALGIDEIRLTSAAIPDTIGDRYRQFIGEGRHGSMSWLAGTPDRRARPVGLWPDVKTIVVCGMSYAPPADPLPELAIAEGGYISVYARNRDYHDVLKGRLKQLAGWLHSRLDCEVKVFVDTAPVLEKPLAAQAGLGWQGKHTNLVSRRHGSWLFLGEIFLDADLRSDEAEIDHCGTCRQCLDICPTDAFPTAYQIDARRCISYLTIEHQGQIDKALRPLIGNRIYGCDDCLAVCPWNKFAKTASEAKLQARPDLIRPDLARLASLDDAGFRRQFAGSPIKRIGRDRFVRNVLIAIGNSREPRLAATARSLLDDPSWLIRGMAAWALRRLSPRSEVETARLHHLAVETDPRVIEEWSA